MDNTHAINWFEIPVTDVPRAKSFYEQVFDISMQQSEMMGMTMVMFPADYQKGYVSGALVQSEMHQPGTAGSLLYLNANPDMEGILSRIEAAGGQIVMPRTLIDEQTGYMAFFTDTEGNRIGLHSSK